MGVTLTTTALDGTPVSFDLETATVNLPLSRFWTADVRSTGTVGSAANPAGTPLDVSNQNTATFPGAGRMWGPNGTELQFSGGAVPAWIFAGLQQYSPVTLTLGSQSFQGAIVRSGIWRGSVHLRVQAGATWIGGFPGPGLARQNATVLSIIQALAGAAGATLSSTIVPAELALQVSFQPNATLRFSQTLDQLVGLLNASIGATWAAQQEALWPTIENLWPTPNVVPTPDLYHWRILPDGTLWVGLDFYAGTTNLTTGWNPPVPAMAAVDADSAVVTAVDNRPEEGLETYGVTAPVLLPGDTYVSEQTPYSWPWVVAAAAPSLVSLATFVRYEWDAQDPRVKMRMSVLNGASNSPVTGLVSTQQGGQGGGMGW